MAEEVCWKKRRAPLASPDVRRKHTGTSRLLLWSIGLDPLGQSMTRVRFNGDTILEVSITVLGWSSDTQSARTLDDLDLPP